MSGILEQLTQHLSGNALDSLSQSIGADRSQTQTALTAALPLLVGALAKNAAKPDGAAALAGALQRDHDGSILDNVSGALANPNLDNGRGILKHVFGGKDAAVTAGLSKATGLQGDQTSKMMAALAPLVLGSLGKARGAQNLSADGLSSLLAGEQKNLQSNQSGVGGLLSGLLDRDGDGEIMDDVASGLMGRLFRK